MERIIASVRINKQDIAVRVLSVFKTGDGRKVAHVEALPVNGRQIEPFTNYSIGGPYQSSHANVRLEFLRGISRIAEPETQAPPPQKQPVIGIVRVNGTDVEVEVNNVYTTPHGERIAEVHARPVNGKQPAPFMNYSVSRGTPYTSTARIPASEIIGLSLAEGG